MKEIGIYEHEQVYIWYQRGSVILLSCESDSQRLIEAVPFARDSGLLHVI